MIRNIPRALRLSFITASVLPFVFGSLIGGVDFRISVFLLGIICVIAVHLSANLINDYADSKSGADWQDKNFYKFFGGSKLIQEKVFSLRFYLGLAVLFTGISLLSAILLSVVMNSFLVLWFYLVVIALSWLYSTKPIQFSYHRSGEFIIFLLFGPVLVMGGYYVQTKIFPDLKSFVLSIPLGFLTTAILFANEVPDSLEDKNAGKLNWVSLIGPSKAFILYAILTSLAFLTIVLSVSLKYLHPVALVSVVFIFPALKAAKILKLNFNDKIKLVESSKLTIVLQAFVSIVLILSALFKTHPTS